MGKKKIKTYEEYLQEIKELDPESKCFARNWDPNIESAFEYWKRALTTADNPALSAVTIQEFTSFIRSNYASNPFLDKYWETMWADVSKNPLSREELSEIKKDLDQLLGSTPYEEWLRSHKESQDDTSDRTLNIEKIGDSTLESDEEKLEKAVQGAIARGIDPKVARDFLSMPEEVQATAMEQMDKQYEELKSGGQSALLKEQLRQLKEHRSKLRAQKQQSPKQGNVREVKTPQIGGMNFAFLGIVINIIAVIVTSGNGIAIASMIGSIFAYGISSNFRSDPQNIPGYATLLFLVSGILGIVMLIVGATS